MSISGISAAYSFSPPPPAAQTQATSPQAQADGTPKPVPPQAGPADSGLANLGPGGAPNQQGSLGPQGIPDTNIQKQARQRAALYLGNNLDISV